MLYSNEFRRIRQQSCMLFITNHYDALFPLAVQSESLGIRIMSIAFMGKIVAKVSGDNMYELKRDESLFRQFENSCSGSYMFFRELLPLSLPLQLASISPAAHRSSPPATLASLVYLETH